MVLELQVYITSSGFYTFIPSTTCWAPERNKGVKHSCPRNWLDLVWLKMQLTTKGKTVAICIPQNTIRILWTKACVYILQAVYKLLDYTHNPHILCSGNRGMLFAECECELTTHCWSHRKSSIINVGQMLLKKSNHEE